MRLLIPSILIGSHKTVTASVRSFLGELSTGQTIEVALENCQWLALDNVPGNLLIAGPGKDKGDRVRLYVLPLEIHRSSVDACDSRIEANRRIYRFTKMAAEHFWFCLSMLGADPVWIVETEDALAGAWQEAGYLLKRMLKWWDVFVSLDGRFADAHGVPAPWPRWCWRMTTLCWYMRLDVEAVRQFRMALHAGRIGPAEAREIFESWVNENI